MHTRTLIKNATIVNEGRQFVGSLVIDNDRIALVLEGHDAQPERPTEHVIDATGCYLSLIHI